MKTLESQLTAMMFLAQEAHKGQLYGKHDYYTYHILGVLAVLITLPEFKSADPISQLYMMIIVIGHDILEDSDITAVLMINLGYDPIIVDALTLLEQKNNMGMQAYISAIKKSPLAHPPKKADIMFNLNESIATNEPVKIKRYSERLARVTIIPK